MAGVGFGDLDDRQGVSQRIHARAAVVLRHFDAHQAHRAHHLHGFERKFAAFVEFGGNRGDLLPGEVAHGAAQRFVFFGQLGH